MLQRLKRIFNFKPEIVQQYTSNLWVFWGTGIIRNMENYNGQIIYGPNVCVSIYVDHQRLKAHYVGGGSNHRYPIDYYSMIKHNQLVQLGEADE